MPQAVNAPVIENLLDLMGMYEMELAVEILLKMSEERGIPFGSLEVGPTDFRTGMELDGFCHLLANGWMSSSYPNGLFKVTPKLAQRVGQRLRKLKKEAP